MLHIYTTNFTSNNINSTSTSEFDIPDYPKLSLLVYDLDKTVPRIALLLLSIYVLSAILYLFVIQTRYWLRERAINADNVRTKRDQYSEVQKGAAVAIVRDPDDIRIWTVSGVSFAELPRARDLHFRTTKKMRLSPSSN